MEGFQKAERASQPGFREIPKVWAASAELTDEGDFRTLSPGRARKAQGRTRPEHIHPRGRGFLAQVVLLLVKAGG